MSIYISLLLLWAVVVYIVDLSGWTDFWLGLSHQTCAKKIRRIRAAILEEYAKLEAQDKK